MTSEDLFYTEAGRWNPANVLTALRAPLVLFGAIMLFVSIDLNGLPKLMALAYTLAWLAGMIVNRSNNDLLMIYAIGALPWLLYFMNGFDFLVFGLGVIVVGIATDWADGYVARKMDVATEEGVGRDAFASSLALLLLGGVTLIAALLRGNMMVLAVAPFIIVGALLWRISDRIHAKEKNLKVFRTEAPVLRAQYMAVLIFGLAIAEESRLSYVSSGIAGGAASLLMAFLAWECWRYYHPRVAKSDSTEGESTQQLLA